MIKIAAKKIYYNLPDKIKYGKKFNDTYDFLQQCRWWSQEQHREYQLHRLKELIKYCYANVPYYTELFTKNKIIPEDIKGIEDIKNIPYLTKAIIASNQHKLISKKFNVKKLKYMVTGGTTGIPMGFYADRKTDWPLECAHVANLWSCIGYDPGKRFKMAVLRGSIPRKGEFEYIGTSMIMSSFLLNNKNTDAYIKKLQDYQPDYIQAYPSSITLLAEHIEKYGIKIYLRKLKALICGSESLYDFQRELLERVFKVRIYSFYGHTEHCCLAGECEKSSLYHLDSQYGYAELINENGHEAGAEGERGEIVCTGFNNLAFPFIRYRTGDFALNTNERCSCGRNHKILKRIEGREQDYFIDKWGSRVTLTCSDDALWEVKDKIYIYQYVQQEPGKVILYIQPKAEFNIKDVEQVEKSFKRFYPTFEVEVSFKDEIERTRSGKFRYLVQKIEF